MKYLIRYSFVIVVLPFLSCEDEISPELESADPVLVVDAWLNNKDEDQIIRLTETQPYFDNTPPTGVSGAQVVVVDDQGKIYPFTESDEVPGQYNLVAISAGVFGEVGRSFELTIQIGADEFKAFSTMSRVPPIDSITFTFEEETAFQEESYIAEFWAVDPKGEDDRYWIKGFKNGVLLNRPSEINLAYDAGFSASGNFDGVPFIAPIRREINPFDVDDNTNLVKNPYKPLDSVYVEIHSITLEAFNFMNQVVIQTDRPGGFSELFATPLANVSTNIVVTKGNRKVVGFFNTAAVSAAGKRLRI
ncbi:MAG TPA: DUF4249 domain-containing protein [Cyclobacteriaceae bacterium]|nr:DUF4249 domain-containing protein [Cyclobacteriaceae bacterium]